MFDIPMMAVHLPVNAMVDDAMPLRSARGALPRWPRARAAARASPWVLTPPGAESRGGYGKMGSHHVMSIVWLYGYII